MAVDITAKDKTYLPALTARLVKDLDQIDNFSIRFNRALLRSGDKFVFIPEKESPNNWNPKFGDVSNFLSDMIERQKCAITALMDQPPEEISLKQNWRLAIGLGNASVLVNGFTLHHVYGVPYLPAEAVKGVVRNYIIEVEFSKSEAAALIDHGFRQVFGSPKNALINEEKKGIVNFYDAFPIALPSKCIQPDVIGTHFQDFFEKGKAPTDTLQVNPIIFLTVKEVTFTFFYATSVEENNIIVDIPHKEDGKGRILQKERKSRFSGMKPQEVITKYFEEAMSINGIGAKTGVGYGRLNK